MARENNLLDENELKKVSGGNEPEPEIVGISRCNAYCSSCKMSYPSSYDKCPKCGKTLLKPITE